MKDEDVNLTFYELLTSAMERKVACTYIIYDRMNNCQRLFSNYSALLALVAKSVCLITAPKA